MKADDMEPSTYANPGAELGELNDSAFDHDYPFAFPAARAAGKRLRGEPAWATGTAQEATSLIGFTLPGTAFSVQMARFYVQSALRYYDLGDYAGDVEMVTSELVSNAIKHAGARAVNLELMRLADSGAVVVVVDDPSPDPPVKRDLADDAESGRGLHVVAALAARWGWTAQAPGKAVFAIFTGEG
jgi:anti-sigma regulatory factor (Ser/Thr protein kinase)